MTSPSRSKAKAQELERIRRNQQRSRERKRAYIAELERKVAQLAEQVEQNQPATACPNSNAPTLHLRRLKRENDARRDLLSALGIAVPTQDIFIRAFAIRIALGTTDGAEIIQGRSASDETEVQDVNLHAAIDTSFPNRMASAVIQNTSIDKEWSSDALKYPVYLRPDSPSSQPYQASHSPPNLSSFLKPPLSRVYLTSSSTAGPSTDIAIQENPSGGSNFSNTLWGQRQVASTQSTEPMSEHAFTDLCASSFQSPVGPGIPTIHDAVQLLPTSSSETEFPSRPIAPPTPATLQSMQPDGGFCAWHTAMRMDDYASDRSTACSIALSMVNQHNNRGLSTTELESRLKAGYRSAEVSNEDCRILNRVLFSVLAEIT